MSFKVNSQGSPVGASGSTGASSGTSPSPGAIASPTASPSSSSSPGPSPSPGIGVKQVAAGAEHTCALFNDDAVRCWGFGGHGELGDGKTQESAYPTRVKNLGTGIRSIGALGYSTCAVFNDGTVKCWGANWSGQLGDGTFNDSALPVTVTGLDHVIQVGGGEDFACAVKDSGEVWCWGYNQFGQAGDNTGTDHTSPVQIAGITNAIQVAGNYGAACARLLDGKIKCWGRNDEGNLGNGNFTSTHIPVQVVGITTATSISGGTWDDNFCAALANGTGV